MKILLIEDHKMFRESLKNSLEKSEDLVVNILEKFSNLDFELLRGNYDIILMDINLSGISKGEDGLELSKEILKKFPDLKIVILTGFNLTAYEDEAKKIGCYGFISKDESTENFISCLNDVYYNDKKIFKKDLNNKINLSEREIEIVKLYTSGLTRKEVAEKLFVSIRTLAVELARIYEKLGVNNYQGLVKKCLELGYIKIQF